MDRLCFNKKVTSFLLTLFLIFCFFPYLRLLPLNLDSQPNALLLSLIVIILFMKTRINRDIAWLLFVLIAAVVCMIISWEDTLGLRILTNYLSLFFISYATYLTLLYFKGIPYTLFKWAVGIWFAVGIIQYFIWPSFLSFLLLRSDNVTMIEHGRGVTSLAPEPTFYAMICLLLLIVNHLNFRNRNSYKSIIVLLVAQIFLSRSTTCFFIIAISFFLYGIFRILKSKYRIRWLFGVIIVGCIGYYGVFYLIENVDIRLAVALRHLLDNPSTFLSMDYSVNNRFMHAFFPFKGFFDNWGMPHGLGHFDDYMMQIINNPTYNQLITFDVSGERKTATSIGGPLFELGIFALPIYYILINAFIMLNRKGRNVEFCFFLLIALMLNTMNFNCAILDLVIGNIIYLKNNTYHENICCHSDL